MKNSKETTSGAPAPPDDRTAKNMELILDGFFKTRSPLPRQNVAGKAYQLEEMTTSEINRQLLDMMNIPKPIIVDYMLAHGYTTMTMYDGAVVWSIYRDTSGVGI